MNTADKPMLRHERLVVISVAIAAIAGIAAGFFILPSRTTATDYVYLLVTPAGFGALCLIAVRRDGQVGRWMPLFLVAIFLLDIANRPHVALLSALGVGAGAVAVVATLRSHQPLAVVSTAVCSALLAATLVGGLLLR
jgi:hypothetical protein